MASLADQMRRARERDKQFIMRLDLEFMDKVLLPLYIAYLCLDFLDVYSTLLALKTALLRELNPIASTLFSLHFDGFLLAIAFKYLPAIPLFFLIFVKDSDNRHPFEIRVVRFAALVALVSVDGLLGYIVVWNNIPTLLGFFKG